MFYVHICAVFPLFTSYSDYCAHKKICYIGENDGFTQYVNE